MATDDKKVVEISAIQKDSPGASDLDESDREWQQQYSHSGEGTFEVKDGHQFYRPIDSYEGIHRWDPNFEWTKEEEQKIVKKIDTRVLTFACVTFFALQLDRGNISQALASTLLEDLNMTSNDYNLGQTIFLFCFLLAEMPSQLISKRLGPDRWIPTQMVLWKGGFIPDTVLFLSFFYKSNELPKRLTCFWVASKFTGIVGAFLAFGFLQIKSSEGLGPWRYLFAYKGLITGVIGIIAAFWMPASLVQTKGGLRGKNGWFNGHEEKIIVNRVLRDDPSKGSMHNRQAVTPKLLWQSLQDYHMWPIYAIGLIWQIPFTPATNYLTLQLKEVGFATFHVNLLTIPAAIVSIITITGTIWLAERTNQRFFLGAAVEAWSYILLIVLEVLPEKSMPWPRWAILTLLVGTPSINPVLVALTSRNAGSVRTRTVASALYNMSVQLGAISGANVYQDSDAPYYKHGNKVLIALAVVSFFLFISAKFYYDWLNSEQREQYLSENPILNNKRLDFRFSR
ncbi:hypothetical protein N7488_010710 [Penicillium malachiteum]|nr:hypothetical protein N7488_010710 [Penicillium malachiteum]